ncbi:MAG TPA: DUF2357 domain-containing protein [Ktedonobacteraceae bacterium]|jgi:predicted component of viral defense system (DUF524 family)
MATPASGVNRWLTINGQPVSFDAGTENAVLSILEYAQNTIEITGDAPAHIALWIDGQQLRTAHYGIWNWNPVDYAGLYRVEVQAPGTPRFSTWIRVFPRKLTRRLYETMQNELSEIALDLLYRLDSPAYERAAYIPRVQETSPLHDYIQIRGMITDLCDIMTLIRRDPHHALREQSVQRDWQTLAYFSAQARPLPGAVLSLPASVARQHGLRYLPSSWQTQERCLTYDTYENRLLKQFLQKQLGAKLTMIERRARNEEQRLQAIYTRYHNKDDGKTLAQLQVAIDECQQMKQRCVRWGSEPFLQAVQSQPIISKATQVLLKHPTYSRFYHLYLLFQQRLKTTRDIQAPVSELATRRVSELYEMWSVFTITRLAVEILLAAGYQMISNTTFFEVEKDYFQFQVRKNTASIVMCKDDLRLVFLYEPVYPNRVNSRHACAVVASSMGDNPLTPDLALEQYRGDIPRHILIFDAKYRRERSRSGLYYPKDEDIDKMYRYKNRIQYQTYTPDRANDPYTLESIVSCAYILYPGDQIHREPDESIGALPLKPGLPAPHLEHIRAQLNRLLSAAGVIA